MRTISYGNDRIDQRTPDLDGKYIHRGTGRGVTVYIFDAGILDNHPEIFGRVRLGYNHYPNDPLVCNPHGTAVASAIAGKTFGVAPEAKIVGLKIVECGSLRGTLKSIDIGVDSVVSDHNKNGGPSVVVWPLVVDTSGRSTIIDSSVTKLLNAGISVVVSASNFELEACDVSPANSPGVIAVGASDLVIDKITGIKKDVRSSGTAFGSCIDVYAPGYNVLLASTNSEGKPTVQLWRGTSLSAGYVGGAVALYLEDNPKATPEEVKDYIKKTATQDIVENTNSVTSRRLLYVGIENPRKQ